MSGSGSLVDADIVTGFCPAAANLDPANLQLLIEANEELMNSVTSAASQTAGAGSHLFTRVYGRRTLLLPERVASITSVTEHWTYDDHADDLVLDPSDYLLSPDGTAIERIPDGLNQHVSGGFADEVTVVYVGVSNNALRQKVLAELVCWDVTNPGSSVSASGGITRRRLGDYEEEHSGGSAASAGPQVKQSKEDILSQLAPQALPVFS